MAPKGKAKADNKAKSDAKAGPAKESGGGKPKTGMSVNSRHILCEKFSKKEEALRKLEEGVPFSEVAKIWSEDKARQGGSLGWKTRGSLDPAYEKVAYTLEVSTNGKRCVYGETRTSHGYHIICVDGRR